MARVPQLGVPDGNTLLLGRDLSLGAAVHKDVVTCVKQKAERQQWKKVVSTPGTFIGSVDDPHHITL